MSSPPLAADLDGTPRRGQERQWILPKIELAALTRHQQPPAVHNVALETAATGGQKLDGFTLLQADRSKESVTPMGRTQSNPLPPSRTHCLTTRHFCVENPYQDCTELLQQQALDYPGH
ncbi:hypothetical protein L3Q82_009798 [Scortum barcoo]|uniref:Uncharacterized protein n=1 Tax=Scortum barcoo TaxID=214431 RepID=A0ACB8WET0_9TELE|nr:hypothetical protein L3Q82_009798 [Scortum barcoo]